MTDKEAFKAMLTRAGVVFVEEGSGVAIIAQNGPKNKGYYGFSADFTFKEDGSLDEVGCWE